jgi:hypothetical protein
VTTGGRLLTWPVFNHRFLPVQAWHIRLVSKTDSTRSCINEMQCAFSTVTHTLRCIYGKALHEFFFWNWEFNSQSFLCNKKTRYNNFTNLFCQETCRLSWQNKFVKLVHLFGFITKKFVTMHGHTKVKFILLFSCHTRTFLEVYATLQIISMPSVTNNALFSKPSTLID